MHCTNQAGRAKPTVLGVERIHNPHIIPIFDELYRRPEIDFTGCVLLPLFPDRVALGWTEIDEASPYIQPWRSAEQRARYHAAAASADVVIWPGLKHPRGMRMILKRNLQGKINMLWAERFLGKRRRPWYEYQAMRMMVRLANSRYVHLMTMGQGAAEEYRAFGATRWTMWQFGYAVRPVIESDHDLTPAPDGVLRLLFVGGLRKLKGIDVLFQALSRADLAQKRWTLRIVGAGQERGALEALAGQLHLSNRVEFAGAITHDKIDEVYGQADVLILPSRVEGWGAPVNEAMEHGLAIVASDAVGCARILVKEGLNGFVFPSADVDALADCLGRVLGEPGLCASMRRASRERIEQFRPAEAARRVAAVCRAITGHGPMPDFPDGYCRALD